MQKYSAAVSEDYDKSGKRTDFWSSNLYHELRSDGLFTKPTDVTLFLTTDDAKVSSIILSLYIIINL